jgi:protein-L-isoaspartate(D-aspartate) O-methyltransferase
MNDKNSLIEYLKSEKFDSKILNAFSVVKREAFLPEGLRDYAYIDQPLPIGDGVTISQPYTIAFMLSLLELKNNQKILEIGSGSGYVLGLINKISKKSKIYSIERIKRLVTLSKKRLDKSKNIKIEYGDGTNGLKKYAPYDRILISASCKKIPTNLFNQLKDGGIIVTSVKQSIIQIKKLGKKKIIKEYPGFVFVPLIKGVE